MHASIQQIYAENTRAHIWLTGCATTAGHFVRLWHADRYFLVTGSFEGAFQAKHGQLHDMITAGQPSPWQEKRDPINDDAQLSDRGLAITVAARVWPPLPAIRAVREAVRANLHTEKEFFLCIAACVNRGQIGCVSDGLSWAQQHILRIRSWKVCKGCVASRPLT